MRSKGAMGDLKAAKMLFEVFAQIDARNKAEQLGIASATLLTSESRESGN